MSFIIIKYLILAVVLVVIALVVMKAGKDDFNLEANKLVEYLGGKNNIESIEVSVSRFIVTLKDTSVVNKLGIQKLGAQGIVEIDNQLKIILKEDAKKLKKYIDEIDI